MWLFQKKYTHDVFISHAFEDKGVIADELYTRLHLQNLNVWYSGNALTTGEDLKEEIDKAIDVSRFGVVIFSKNSINRLWLNTELNALEKKENNRKKVVLPVLFEMTAEELAPIYPRVAAKVCIRASRGMDYVVDQILEEIKKERQQVKKNSWIKLAALFSVILFLSLIIITIVRDRPTKEQIESSIQERIEKLVTTVDQRYVRLLASERTIVRPFKIDSLRTAFQDFKSYFRNEYEFNNGYKTIRGRKNVETALACNLVDLAEIPIYGMDSVDIYWKNPIIYDGFHLSSFNLVNKRPVAYSWEGEKNGSVYTVKVHFAEGIRYINVDFTLPPNSAGTKRHEMKLLGIPSLEVFHFDKGSDGEWHFRKIE